MTAAPPSSRTLLAAGVAVAVFALANANGRVIGSGDSRAAEFTALSLLERGTFVLETAPENDPFTRPVAGGWLSIYPPATPLLAAPVFGVVRAVIDVDETGRAVAGKVAATLFAALAAGVMTLSYAARTTPGRAVACGLAFGLGTGAFAASQTLWQHPVTALFIAIGLSLVAAGAGGAPLGTRAGAAGFCLATAAAARPAAALLCLVLFAGLIATGATTLETRTRLRFALLGAFFPVVTQAAYNDRFFGAPWSFGPEGLGGRFFAAFPESLAGLLVSPARGLIVFTPLVLVALMGLRDLSGGPLRALLVTGLLTHLGFISLWNEWHGGESFGPRLLTDALPLALWALPEGLARAPRLFAVLVAWSIAVQGLGGWTYDYRWERLYQRGREFDAALWSWRDSPIAFHAREGVVTQGIPVLSGRRLRLPASRFVPFGPAGNRIEGDGAGLRVSGDAVVRDIRLERGARVESNVIVLRHPQDALAFRVLASGDIAIDVEVHGSGALSVLCPSRPSEAAVSGTADTRVSFRCAADARDDVALRAPAGTTSIRSVTIRR